MHEDDNIQPIIEIFNYNQGTSGHPEKYPKSECELSSRLWTGGRQKEDFIWSVNEQTKVIP